MGGLNWVVTGIRAGGAGLVRYYLPNAPLVDGGFLAFGSGSPQNTEVT